jgi:hypothetical protein
MTWERGHPARITSFETGDHGRARGPRSQAGPSQRTAPLVARSRGTHPRNRAGSESRGSGIRNGWGHNYPETQIEAANARKGVVATGRAAVPQIAAEGAASPRGRLRHLVTLVWPAPWPQSGTDMPGIGFASTPRRSRSCPRSHAGSCLFGSNRRRWSSQYVSHPHWPDVCHRPRGRHSEPPFRLKLRVCCPHERAELGHRDREARHQEDAELALVPFVILTHQERPRRDLHAPMVSAQARGVTVSFRF